jgi:cobalt-zinc-cadmium efflux system membrane fusion protein
MKKIVYVFVLAIILLSCKKEVAADASQANDQKIAITKEQFLSAAMEISTLKESEFDGIVIATGQIDVPPQNRTKVKTFLAGYVKSAKLMVGDKVSKGQLLLTLENSEYIDIQKEYLEVAEQIKYLKSEYDRQKTLFEEKITSQKNYLKAESDYRVTKGMYQGLKEKLRLLNINPVQVERGNFTSVISVFAPISGDITVMNATVGMYVAPDDVILEIVDTNHLQVDLAVFEKDILQVKVGQNIRFRVPEASKESFNATVHLVGKSIEGNDRTIKVYGKLDPKVKQFLLTGMFVEAEIIVNSKKGLAVPTDALIIDGELAFLLVLSSENNGYVFDKVAVNVGEKSEHFVEIMPNKWITPSSKILTKGVFEVAN